MRVTRAGSWATILCRCAGVDLGSSTVAIIFAVISGSVAMLLTFLTISRTAAGWVSITLEFAVALDIFFPFPFGYAQDIADLLRSIGDISSVREKDLIGDEL